jgi:hypothetical protein
MYCTALCDRNVTVFPRRDSLTRWIYISISLERPILYIVCKIISTLRIFRDGFNCLSALLLQYQTTLHYKCVRPLCVANSKLLQCKLKLQNVNCTLLSLNYVLSEDNGCMQCRSFR